MSSRLIILAELLRWLAFSRATLRARLAQSVQLHFVASRFMPEMVQNPAALICDLRFQSVAMCGRAVSACLHRSAEPFGWRVRARVSAAF